MENITINGEFVIKQLLHCEENIDSRIVSASKLAPVPEIKQDECTESITTAMIVFIKEIFLHKTIFYINNLSAINLDEATSKTSGEYLTREDKVILMRHSFAPLLIFDIAVGTMLARQGGAQKVICLPGYILFPEEFEIHDNSLLTNQIVNNVVKSLVGLLEELNLDKNEIVLIKLIIFCGMDSFIQGSNGRENLSSNGKIFVQKLYDFAFDTITKKALKILPKLMYISPGLVEHIRKGYTSPSTSSLPPGMFADTLRELFPPNQEDIVESISPGTYQQFEQVMTDGDIWNILKN